MPNAAISHLTISHELTLEFLATFSRLEYALKVGGYLQKNNGEAKANWKDFVANLKGSSTLQKLDSFNYLLKYPLKMLGSEGERVNWVKFDTSKAENEIENVVLKIKQIRNNLFHGGKYAYSDNSNDERLLTSSIEVLLKIKSILPKINSAYDN